MRCVHLLVKGKVQGVFYRVTAKKVADIEQIKGTVKNTSEGHVQIIACGEEDNIESFIEWAKQGPARAAVTQIEITNIPLQDFDEFKIVK